MSTNVVINGTNTYFSKSGYNVEPELNADNVYYVYDENNKLLVCKVKEFNLFNSVGKCVIVKKESSIKYNVNQVSKFERFHLGGLDYDRSTRIEVVNGAIISTLDKSDILYEVVSIEKESKFPTTRTTWREDFIFNHIFIDTLLTIDDSNEIYKIVDKSDDDDVKEYPLRVESINTGGFKRIAIYQVRELVNKEDLPIDNKIPTFFYPCFTDNPAFRWVDCGEIHYTLYPDTQDIKFKLLNNYTLKVKPIKSTQFKLHQSYVFMGRKCRGLSSLYSYLDNYRYRIREVIV